MWSSLPFLYPPRESPLVAALSVVSGVSLGISELRGGNMPYSKFSQAGSRGLPSRGGMLLSYAPALLAVPGAADGLRTRLLAAALAVHFLKRVLEVLFVHRYGGSMPHAMAFTVSIGYLLSSITMLYAQHLSRGLPDPAVDLLYPGVLVFAVGATGNLYHHHLLSRLRADVGKGYKIPTGGLFELVACPHYLFEIVVFLGLAMIAQTVFALALAAYLAGRSCATRRWYASKLRGVPGEDEGAGAVCVVVGDSVFSGGDVNRRA